MFDDNGKQEALKTLLSEVSGWKKDKLKEKKPKVEIEAELPSGDDDEDSESPAPPAENTDMLEVLLKKLLGK